MTPAIAGAATVAHDYLPRFHRHMADRRADVEVRSRFDFGQPQRKGRRVLAAGKRDDVDLVVAAAHTAHARPHSGSRHSLGVFPSAALRGALRTFVLPQKGQRAERASVAPRGPSAAIFDRATR